MYHWHLERHPTAIASRARPDIYFKNYIMEIEKEVLDLEMLKEFCLSYWERKKLSFLHGPEHWERVANNVKKLWTNAADKYVCMAFAYLHDCERVSDTFDPDHGARAAKLIEVMRNSIFLKNLSNEQIDILKYACEVHNKLYRAKDPTIGVCLDADRLDLVRCNIIPSIERMSTSRGQAIVKAMPEGERGTKLICALLDILQTEENIIDDCFLVHEIIFMYGDIRTIREDFIQVISRRYSFDTRTFAMAFRAAYLCGLAPESKEVCNLERNLLNKISMRHIMTAQEYRLYERLPDKISLYRGTSEKEWLNYMDGGNLGLSWTIHPDIAYLYAAASLWRQETETKRIVIKVSINKADAKAYFSETQIGFPVIAEAVYLHREEYGKPIIIERDVEREKGVEENDMTNAKLIYKSPLGLKIKMLRNTAIKKGTWPLHD